MACFFINRPFITPQKTTFSLPVFIYLIDIKRQVTASGYRYGFMLKIMRNEKSYYMILVIIIVLGGLTT